MGHVRISRDGRDYVADIDGIPACGSGPTAEAAIYNLCELLGDFVLGHKATIERLEGRMGEARRDGVPEALAGMVLSRGTLRRPVRPRPTYLRPIK